MGDEEGEWFGDDVGVTEVAGPVVGPGVVVAEVRSDRREGGSYVSLSATDNAIATAAAATKDTGASIAARATRVDGRTRPPMTCHHNAANTSTAATDNHHG